MPAGVRLVLGIHLFSSHISFTWWRGGIILGLFFMDIVTINIIIIIVSFYYRVGLAAKTRLSPLYAG